MTEVFLSELVALWEKVIERARKRKWEQFGKTADRAWAFLGKNYQSLYVDARDDSGEKFPHVERGIWQTRRNLSRDYVSTMLPYIHSKVPTRLVLPRRPGMPPELLELAQQSPPQYAQSVAYADMLQKALAPTDSMRAFLLKWWLNFLPSEYDLFSEQRRALPEALVKGRCIGWTEMVQSAYGLIPATYYDTVDGLLCDPDARNWREQGFIIRERCESVLRTAQKFSTATHRIDPSDLRGKFQSEFRKAEYGANLQPPSEQDNADICVYYEVYSRYGVGHHFDAAGDEMKKFKDALDSMPNCYLAVMPGMAHPLNLLPDALETEGMEEIKRRLAWPIPFYSDMTDPWPCCPCDFMPNQNDPWAASPLEGCLALLAFIDHAYSYLLNRVRTGCKNLFIGSKALTDEFVSRYLEAFDLEWIQYNGDPSADLDKLLKRVEYPDIKRDLLQIVEKVESAFEQSSGMTSAMMGDSPTKQDRSATATEAREARLSSRPNDFADCVEAWNSRIASKECLATRLYVGKEVIMPFFGEQSIEVPDPNLDPEMVALAEQTGQEVPTVTIDGPLTQQWLNLVSVGNAEMTQEELEQAAAVAATELTFTVEAGSGRRKNRQKQIEDYNQMVQTMGPFWVQLATSGQTKPYNALMALGSDVFERSMDAFMLGQGDMPAPEPDPRADSEARKADQEAEAAQRQAEQDQARADQDAANEQRRVDADQDNNLTELRMRAVQHEQEMRHKEEMHRLDMQLKEAQSRAAVAAQKQRAKQRPKKGK